MFESETYISYKQKQIITEELFKSKAQAGTSFFTSTMLSLEISGKQ